MATLCSSDNTTIESYNHHLINKQQQQQQPKNTTTTTNMQSNNNNNNSNKNNKKKSKKGTVSLLGFGCTAHPKVSVPAVIRSSAVWEDNKKNKERKKNVQTGLMLMEDSFVQDLWCGVHSVDCVRPLPSRNKIDHHHHHHHHHHHSSKHGSVSSRQRVNPENLGGLDPDSAFDTSHIGPDVFEAQYYHHLRNRSPERLAEILMFQNGLLMGRRSGGLDRYRDWRLDVDSMTYEELLDLGERIGHVNTGLGEEQIGRCLRKTVLSVVDELSSHSYLPEVEPKCSICQEEYEADDEMGKLECGHAYHLHCIKQWLTRKNTCPVCKAEASSL